jgi:hypothetical protein
MKRPSLILKAGIEAFPFRKIWNDLYATGIEFIWSFALPKG